MARHRKPVPVQGPTRQARRALAVGLASASALAATLLALTVDRPATVEPEPRAAP